jgi:hypothetical protein
MLENNISARGQKYQYGSFRSVQIVLSSNAQQKHSWGAQNLANCRALYKTTTTDGERQTFQRLIPDVSKVCFLKIQNYPTPPLPSGAGVMKYIENQTKMQEVHRSSNSNRRQKKFDHSREIKKTYVISPTHKRTKGRAPV